MGTDWLCFLCRQAKVSLESVAGKHCHHRSHSRSKVHIAVLTLQVGKQNQGSEEICLRPHNESVACAGLVTDQGFPAVNTAPEDCTVSSGTGSHRIVFALLVKGHAGSLTQDKK